MRPQGRRTPDEVTLVGAQETIYLLDGKMAAPRTCRDARRGTFLPATFIVFMGEAECPRVFKQLFDGVRRAYITLADAVTIDRERLALVSKRESFAA
jgi:hypothetical protein